MNPIRFLAVTMFLAIACQAEPPIARPSGSPQSTVAKEAVNYAIRVEWKDAKKGESFLQIVTSEGQFELDTLSGTTKINDSDIPNTVKLNGTLNELSPEKGRLQLFLGRTVPYVTSTYAGPAGRNSSSYSQISVGLQSTFIVTFGKPLTIQTDDNGTVSILVKREEN
ncbi:MAG: hypothetical protein ACREFE_03155 [Limisphaerales bacterium]